MANSIAICLHQALSDFVFTTILCLIERMASLDNISYGGSGDLSIVHEIPDVSKSTFVRAYSRRSHCKEKNAGDRNPD